MSDADAILAELEARHLIRLREMVQREASEDAPGRRLAWGLLYRDSEAGRRKIAHALAKLDLFMMERQQ